MKDTLDKSMSDKLIEMNNCGLRLLSIYGSDNTIFDCLSKEDKNLIWAVGEGHTAEFYLKRIEGRCSLRDSLDFDMEEAEYAIENIIQHLRRLEEAIAKLKITAII